VKAGKKEKTAKTSEQVSFNWHGNEVPSALHFLFLQVTLQNK
jgi:hypothetical protein